jgi:hypothetical protein
MSSGATNPFTPKSLSSVKIHPGIPIRISSGAGLSHQLFSTGGLSFELSSDLASDVSGPPRTRDGIKKTATATKDNFLFISVAAGLV